MRVFLDTNVLVSAVATRGICSDILVLVLSEHQLVLGETVLAELERVLRTKIRVPDETIRETLDLLRREAAVISIAPTLNIDLADKSDIPVISEAVAAEAEIFVTGDTGFSDLSEAVPIRILSPRGFWDSLRAAT